MNLKKEITLYLQTSWNVEQAERAAYILSLISEKVKGTENPYINNVFSHYRYCNEGFEEARQTILKELE